MAKICAFFGHRDIPDNLELSLREQIEHVITHYGITEFWDGCYGDFDHLAAQIVTSLKSQYPHIRLVQVHAYPPSGSTLRRGFDRAFLPDILTNIRDNTCIPRRNIWMAYHCDIIISYVNHAESKIHEPLDRMHGRIPILILVSINPSVAFSDRPSAFRLPASSTGRSRLHAPFRGAKMRHTDLASPDCVYLCRRQWRMQAE